MISLNTLMKIFTNGSLLIGETYKFDLNEKEGWIERLEGEKVIFAFTMSGNEITWDCSSEELTEALYDIGLLE